MEYIDQKEMSRNLYGYGLGINLRNICKAIRIKDEGIFADTCKICLRIFLKNVVFLNRKMEKDRKMQTERDDQQEEDFW